MLALVVVKVDNGDMPFDVLIEWARGRSSTLVSSVRIDTNVNCQKTEGSEAHRERLGGFHKGLVRVKVFVAGVSVKMGTSRGCQ